MWTPCQSTNSNVTVAVMILTLSNRSKSMTNIKKSALNVKVKILSAY